MIVLILMYVCYVLQIWPHGDYPLIPVGKLVLNRNPVNYFAEVEQMAYDPSNMPPGIEPSPDKMLQVNNSAHKIFTWGAFRLLCCLLKAFLSLFV